VAEAEVNAKLVAELRRETGAGMMDCKKALAESDGDKSRALEYLRKKGKAAAEKRADRSADQGLVVCRQSDDGQTAALVEVNSETDFVAKNDRFKEFASDVANIVLAWDGADGKSLDDLKSKPMPAGATVGDVLADLTGAIGEKLAVGRFARVQAKQGFIGTYIHSDSKLGVLVVLEGATGDHAEVKTLGRDLAMQVAASSPTFVHRDEVPADKVAAEREVEIDRARNEGKPEAAVTKIAEGRINKWFADVVLLEQPFVKDPKVVVKDLVADASKKVGSPITVKSFVRIRVGA
jgi:elongation factor Ts